MRLPRPRSATNRRRFIQGLGSAAALAAGARTLSGCASRPRDAQVIVIGAGLAGLNAALLLEEQGVDVLILEASPRIGGRVHTLDQVPGRPEAGGTEIGAGYGRVRDMAARVGGGLRLERWMDTVELALVMHVDGQTYALSDWAGATANNLPDSERSLIPAALLARYAARPSPLADLDSWLSPAAAELDISYGEYLRARGASEAALRILSREIPSGDVATMSALWQLRSERAFSLMGSLQDLDRISAGSSRLTEGMAALLRREIRLNTPVTRLTTAPDQVQVRDSSGRTFRAESVICTVPLTLLRQMQIEPAPPPLQAAAIREIPYGPMTSVYFTVRSRYWDEDGLPAGIWSNQGFNQILPFVRAEGDYLWMIIKDAAFAGLGDDEIRARTTADLARIRPSTVGRVEATAVVNWSSYPWMMGHSTYFEPGQITRFGGAFARPHGRIHFAGEHTSLSLLGMEGAMESGERAALEVLASS